MITGSVNKLDLVTYSPPVKALFYHTLGARGKPSSEGLAPERIRSCRSEVEGLTIAPASNIILIVGSLTSSSKESQESGRSGSTTTSSSNFQNFKTFFLFLSVLRLAQFELADYHSMV